jgi:hypothetical protein
LRWKERPRACTCHVIRNHWWRIFFK